MKKKLIHAGMLSLLSMALVFSFVSNSKAVDDDAIKAIEIMQCCARGVSVAVSNNCKRGAGDCIANPCPPGTVQVGISSNPCEGIE